MARKPTKTADQPIPDTAPAGGLGIEAGAAMPAADQQDPAMDAPAPSDRDVAPAPPAAAARPSAAILALGVALGLGAGAIGYGAAMFYPLPLAGGRPDAAPDLTRADLDALAARIDALNLDAINARLTALETAPAPAPVAAPDLAPLAAQIADLQRQIAAIPLADDLRAKVDELAGRLAQSDPAPAIKAAIAAEMASVQQAAQAMMATVETAAREAKTSAALIQLRAALDSGAPFAAAADVLALPDVLADHAAQGIPSLTALRDGFAGAARAGLDAALRADMGQTWGERVTNFLRGQTGARSLTPREGDDPDAILSRIDAALGRADLAAAIDEVAGLPDAAKAAMQPWIDQLNLRSAALVALDTLNGRGE